MSDRYAVLIGSSQFPEEERLQDLLCPEQDVDDLHGLLSDSEHGGFSETHLLKNRPHHEVLRTLNRVLKKAAKDDLVLIYYSGHGKLDPAGRLYLATCDTEFDALEATSIPVQSIKSYIDISPSTKTALILDCCYSGAVQKAFFRGEVDEQLNLMSGGRGTFIITASTGIQLAKEKEEDRNGVFTKHLIEGIRGGAADRDGDGYITMNEIYQYAHDQVIAESHQEPMKWDLNVRGELYVAKSGKTPREDRRKAVRDHLLKLAGDGLIPDDILSSALEIAALPATGLDGRQKKLDQLLDDIVEGRVGTGNFIGAWYKTQAEPAPEPQAPPPPPPPRQEQASPKTSRASRAKAKKRQRSTRKDKPWGASAQGQGDATAARVAPNFGWLFTPIVFAVIIFVHFSLAASMAPMINEMSWYSSNYGYRIDEAMVTGYFAAAGVILVIMLFLRRFFRRAANNLERSAGFFERLMPRGTSPRAALWASTIGILAFLGINGIVLFNELAWML